MSATTEQEAVTKRPVWDGNLTVEQDESGWCGLVDANGTPIAVDHASLGYLPEIAHRCNVHGTAVRLLASLVALHNFDHLDRGIGTALLTGKALLEAREFVRAERRADGKKESAR